MGRSDGNIIDVLGQEHAEYLHAKGRVSTQFLTEQLSCEPEERILEVGFGTGATLVELASKYSDSEFFGVEASQTMYERGSKRIKFCRVAKNVSCYYNAGEITLPFPDESMDKVYCESVLGILEEEKLPQMLQEIQRVLVSGGMLLINETIWLDQTQEETISQINEFCKMNYGIIQANSFYPYLRSWKTLLYDSGFDVNDHHKVDDVSDTIKLNSNLSIMLSRLFTFWGKLKNRKQKKRFLDMNDTLNLHHKMMGGVIFKSTKI